MIRSEGVHHITLVGADRKTSVDFWQGVMGMEMLFEQPNLDKPSENHLFFESGDGRMITVFTDEGRAPDATRTATGAGCVHHLAFAVTMDEIHNAVKRLDARGVKNTGIRDRGAFLALYFEDPLGLTIELAADKFRLPEGFRKADVVREANRIRLARDAPHIGEADVAAAIEALTGKAAETV